MNFSTATGELFLSALAYRPVWVKYGYNSAWHALLKPDMKLLSDLHKPACNWSGASAALVAANLVPIDHQPICSTCLVHALNLTDWKIEDVQTDLWGSW